MFLQADTLFIGGELSIPFLLSTGVAFSNVSESISSFCAVCNTLIQKARYRGVRIILPQDLVTGDEELNADALSKCFENVDSSARDEGGDYNGDTKVLSCREHIVGFPYDIGPKSCDILRSELKLHNLHLSWGVLGCCEIAAFQSGQKVLVEVSSSESIIQSGSDAIGTRQLHNIVVGEVAVEWWTRICDPDGEYEGDLVRKCVLDFSSRNSRSVCNVLSLLPSPCLSDAMRRIPAVDEWDYLSHVRRELVEDEEEDEEEEEDDDE